MGCGPWSRYWCVFVVNGASCLLVMMCCAESYANDERPALLRKNCAFLRADPGGALGTLVAPSTACAAVASNSHRFCLTVHFSNAPHQGACPRAWTVSRCQHHRDRPSVAPRRYSESHWQVLSYAADTLFVSPIRRALGTLVATNSLSR